MREKIKLSSSQKPRTRKRTRRIFKLPPDVVSSLKKEFPDVKNVEKIIDKVFDLILRKVIKDGACTITRFGYFFGYKSISSRTKELLPRIKFSISRTLRLDIQNDQYLMDQIPDYSKSNERVAMFNNGSHKNGSQERRRNAEKQRSAARDSARESKVQDEIASILEESFDDEPGM